MTYDPVDTNDDGVVDADVDNESVKTDNATVGGGEAVSIIWGDENDLIRLDSVHFELPLNVSTQSTGYVDVSGDTVDNRPITSTRTAPGIDMTNLSEVYVELVGYELSDNNDTGDTVFASAHPDDAFNEGEVEITQSGGPNFRNTSGLVSLSDIGISLSDFRNPTQWFLEAKVEDTANNPEAQLAGGYAVYIWGEL